MTLGGLTNSASTDSFSLYGSASYAATLVFSSGGAGSPATRGTFELSDIAPLTAEQRLHQQRLVLVTGRRN